MNSKPSSTHKSKTHTQTPRERKPRKITPAYLHNAGLYYLQRFSSSSSNFRDVMLRKVRKSCMAHTDQDFDSCAEMVDALVKKFIDLDLLNDEVYARAVITTMRRQGKSKKAILAKLRVKGLTPDALTPLIEEIDASQGDPEGSELKAALIFARRKKIGPFLQDKERDPQKMLASLARAGFSYATATQTLEMTDEDARSIILDSKGIY